MVSDSLTYLAQTAGNERKQKCLVTAGQKGLSFHFHMLFVYFKQTGVIGLGVRERDELMDQKSVIVIHDHFTAFRNRRECRRTGSAYTVPFTSEHTAKTHPLSDEDIRSRMNEAVIDDRGFCQKFFQHLFIKRHGAPFFSRKNYRALPQQTSV